VTGLQAALPRAHYTDPATWRHEVDRVWRRSWVCVGRLGALGPADSPCDATSGGRVVAVEVAGESVLLTRDDRGLHALANVCRHRGAQLVDQSPGELVTPCAARSLRCRYHSWTYGLDGALLRAPHTDGLEGFDPARFGLTELAVQTWGGYAFVRLGPPTSPPDARADGDAESTSLLTELGEIVARTARYPLEPVGVRRPQQGAVQAVGPGVVATPQ
jgi:Rieske 2Fe-2S family protein